MATTGNKNNGGGIDIARLRDLVGEEFLQNFARDMSPEQFRKEAAKIPSKDRTEALDLLDRILNPDHGRGAERSSNQRSVFTRGEERILRSIEEQLEVVGPEERARIINEEWARLVPQIDNRDEGDVEKAQDLLGGGGNPEKRRAIAKQKQEEIKKFFEEQKDIKNVRVAINSEAATATARDLAALPAGMLKSLFEAFHENKNGDWRVLIAIMGFIEKALSKPFNLAIGAMQEQQEQYGQKWGDKEFLKALHTAQTNEAKRMGTSAPAAAAPGESSEPAGKGKTELGREAGDKDQDAAAPGRGPGG